MAVTEDIATWMGEPVLTEGGDQIGTVDAIFLDEDTSDPEWVAVHLASDGQERVIPIIAITPNGDQLMVTFAAELIASSPSIDLADDIDPDEEHKLYAHYGQASAADVPGDAADAGRVGKIPNRRFRKVGH